MQQQVLHRNAGTECLYKSIFVCFKLKFSPTEIFTWQNVSNFLIHAFISLDTGCKTAILGLVENGLIIICSNASYFITALFFRALPGKCLFTRAMAFQYEAAEMYACSFIIHVTNGLMIWERLSHLARAGYLPRSRCYGHTIVKLDLVLYDESVSPSRDKSGSRLAPKI